MAAAIKMDELLVSWLSSDEVYERVLEWIENYRGSIEANNNKLLQQQQQHQQQQQQFGQQFINDNNSNIPMNNNTSRMLNSGMTAAVSNGVGYIPGSIQTRKVASDDTDSSASTTNVSEQSPTGVILTTIPPFYPRIGEGGGRDGTVPPKRRLRSTPLRQQDTWEPLPTGRNVNPGDPPHGRYSEGSGTTPAMASVSSDESIGLSGEFSILCARDMAKLIFQEIGHEPPMTSPGSVGSSEGRSSTDSERDWLSRRYITVDVFVRVTKEVCRFPSFFNLPLYQRIVELWNNEQQQQSPLEVVTFGMLEWYWKKEMEPYDASDRFYRLVKQPYNDFILRDDFLPFVRSLLDDHPGLEFLSTHAEFQEKYAVTVITRIFYCVNKCHSGRITSRQIRRSDLLEAFHQVDDEEDINKVTRYFSYEHFYVLYCRFWELDHDRDYRITREDLLKYGDHSLSHMIVDRIFDAAPRPFEPDKPNRDYLSYEDFIYFMLSEEDKSNEISVRYWFSCVDVDGDGMLNNMEMRSFYAVQLHRMQCMGHEIVPFEDMLCQMMDMIKPASTQYLVAEDFLKPECSHVAGALFDALFNLNKYLMFEQRDPFIERQKREDEFECDWDRFACVDYNRLAMEEEAREEEAMEIDWVTVDDDDDERVAGQAGVAGGQPGANKAGAAAAGANEAPF